MNPDQNRNGQTPGFGVNSTPQRNENGHFEVVPPPSVTGRSTGHNPYEFIVNPNKPLKKPGLFQGNDFLRRIILMVGGLVIVVILVTVVLNLLVPTKNISGSLISITQSQQEIIRVAAIGSNQASSSNLRNFATTVQVSIGTSQSSILGYLAQFKKVPDAKLLVLGYSKSTDQTLASATATSTFDTAFQQILVSDLSDYTQKVVSTYKTTTNTTTKALLQKNFDTAKLLLSATPSAPNS
jgi:hypothetical protein